MKAIWLYIDLNLSHEPVQNLEQPYLSFSTYVKNSQRIGKYLISKIFTVCVNGFLRCQRRLNESIIDLFLG